MSAFKGYTEITCPLCDRYKHVKNEDLQKLVKDERKYTDDGINSVVCDDCWQVVEFFVQKEFERCQA